MCIRDRITEAADAFAEQLNKATSEKPEEGQKTEQPEEGVHVEMCIRDSLNTLSHIFLPFFLLLLYICSCLVLFCLQRFARFFKILCISLIFSRLFLKFYKQICIFSVRVFIIASDSRSVNCVFSSVFQYFFVCFVQFPFIYFYDIMYII